MALRPGRERRRERRKETGHGTRQGVREYEQMQVHSERDPTALGLPMQDSICVDVIHNDTDADNGRSEEE